jgi:hypothetical protein
MTRIGKRGMLAVAAAALLLAAVGSGVATAQGGPQKSPPRYGMQHRSGGYGLMAGGVVMDAAADYLGMTEAELRAARHDGTSLAQIAVEKGKTSAGLQEALVAAFKANLDKAVAAGRVTQAQATQMLATFKTRVQTIVTRTETGPLGGRRAGAGPGMGFCAGRR